MNRSSLLALIYSGVICFACNRKSSQEVHYPSNTYHFVKVDTAALGNKKSVYVPIYSHIYWPDGKTVTELTATLSVRNMSYTDSFYLTDVIYYGSQGEVLKRYIDSTLLLKPMASYEFVVEHNETKGGAGANFVVKWAAADNKSEPLMQAVMCETSRGVSFVVNGMEMKE